MYFFNIWGKRGLSLSKAVGFDKLNQLRRKLLRRYPRAGSQRGTNVTKRISDVRTSQRALDQEQRFLSFKAAQWTWLGLGIAEVLIGLRVALKLIAANLVYALLAWDIERIIWVSFYRQ